MEKMVLIDGHSMLIRAFYGIPDLTNSEGLHTNAVYGFLNIMFRILEEEKPQYLTVAFDMHAPTFRHRAYAEYKGNRKPLPRELTEQVPLIQEVLRAMGVRLVTLEGYEADDLLGTLARKAEKKGLAVTIVSGDRDLLQLATDRIQIRIPKTRQGKTVIEDYFAEDVRRVYQLEPVQIIALKALMGDSSDNIPGLPGVGEKTATKILLQYGTVENAHAHLEELKPKKAMEAFRDHYDLALLSGQLATINTDSPVEEDYEGSRLQDLFTPEAYSLFRRLEFKNLLSRFSEEQAPDFTVEISSTSDLSEAEAYFAAFAEKDQLGIFALTEGESLYCLAVSDGEKNICFLPEGFLTPAYLARKLRDLHRAGKELWISGCKELLHALPDFAEECRNCSGEERRIYDNQIAAYLLNPLKSSYGYDDIARDYTDCQVPTIGEIFEKAKLPRVTAMTEEQKEKYTAWSACTAALSADRLRQELKEKKLEELFLTMEMPLVFVLYEMETAGMRIRQGELEAYSSRLQDSIAEIEQRIYTQAGEVFNINSPKQLGVILFEKMQLPGGKKTKTGYSTAADVLEQLAAEAPVVADILEYRQLTKLKSTYADGLPACVREDGRIHSTFQQTVTATGRISSTEPNLQNIPIRMELGKEIRKVFIPEEDWVYIDADYSQIELRVLAHMSGDEKLITAFREGQDIHTTTASQVFHVPFDQVTALQRRNAKAVNFGIVYGISAFGLSQDLQISRKEASEYIEGYFATYPGIKSFLDRMVAEAKETGVARTMAGRLRPMPELQSGNFMQRSFGERVAMNAPIQGTAADIIKAAMVRVSCRLKKENKRARLVLQVHDELLIEAPQDEVEEVSALLAEEMQAAAELVIPLEVDLHTGSNWLEAH